MKNTISLTDSWYISMLEPGTAFDPLNPEECCEGSFRSIPARIPAQVHEILLSAGKIDDPRVTGNTEKCKWVAEKDWLYRLSFKADRSVTGSGRSASGPGCRQYLHFKGLDTIADIYLNGSLTGRSEDMYLPVTLDVTGLLKEENSLLIHFHSPWLYLKYIGLPSSRQGKIPPHKYMRKIIHDFSDFLGPNPYLTNIGICGEVQLILSDGEELVDFEAAAALDESLKKGTVRMTAHGRGAGPDSVIEFSVTGPDGKILADRNIRIRRGGAENWTEACELPVKNPSLWWPRSHGEQPLYRARVRLVSGGSVKDACEKTIGFRRITTKEPFDFEINGKPVKLWGANLAPTDRLTNRWDDIKAGRLLDMAENAHMNVLRVWAEGVPASDEFYEEADRRGFLLWQEFYSTYGMQADDAKSKAMCKREAEHLIRRLRHHPSILMWCGGNESAMGAEYDHPGEPVTGESIYLNDYREICERLDPERYYHANSPIGGAFANDPAGGDTHGYTHIWYVPGADYPVMLSENTRISTPVLRSLKKYIGDGELWPEGFNPAVYGSGDCPLPESWMARAPGGVWPRIKNIEKFYDAGSPEALVYRLGAAHALHLKETVERCRRGRPPEDAGGRRRTLGHLVWKLNEPWPAFYSSMVDYYLEAYIPYYTLKRANSPLLLSFDVGNYLYLWIVNDTVGQVKGTAVCRLFNPKTNKVMKEIKRELSVSPDE